ncbi:hypothetical protein [Zunongwangia profunda]|uniref:hypothetical protein n=1 Tax=Zunongwangia profunda TaxID=398743 RepID=UPI001D18EDD2|nr:hypothetical protein [Zunongwangia profunda]MCC4228188.1 hypothetical protein [Zunongwangia profunda]|tara:strand:- start:1938 stop:2354 length:417 start_codon:yes stop_codon:yes gene_type:complete
MRTNFEIYDNSGVKYDGIHIDLHNNFELKSKETDGKNLLIEFLKLNDDWVHENEFAKLTFVNKSVSYEFFENGNNDKYPEDENTLSIIGYFPKSMRDINDGFMQRNKPENDDDIIYIFQNDKTFRISCEEIELIVKKQ